MRKRISAGEIKDKRMLSYAEAQIYVGLGKQATRKLCDKIGATKHYGSRVLFDKYVIDEKLNEGVF